MARENNNLVPWVAWTQGQNAAADLTRKLVAERLREVGLVLLATEHEKTASLPMVDDEVGMTLLAAEKLQKAASLPPMIVDDFEPVD